MESFVILVISCSFNWDVTARFLDYFFMLWVFCGLVVGFFNYLSVCQLQEQLGCQNLLEKWQKCNQNEVFRAVIALLSNDVGIKCYFCGGGIGPA